MYLFCLENFESYTEQKLQCYHLKWVSFVVVIIRFMPHTKWPVTTGALDKYIHVMKTLHWNKLVSVRSWEAEIDFCAGNVMSYGVRNVTREMA